MKPDALILDQNQELAQFVNNILKDMVCIQYKRSSILAIAIQQHDGCYHFKDR